MKKVDNVLSFKNLKVAELKELERLVTNPERKGSKVYET